VGEGREISRKRSQVVFLHGKKKRRGKKKEEEKQKKKKKIAAIPKNQFHAGNG